jgi:16S rRNA (guanine527-N7)-methyltransferase
MSQADFVNHFDVSRETLARLGRYESLLGKWNQTINLVARGTIGTLWSRHFLDSAQLISHAPREGTWLDLGSGGGFPALVIASMVRETHPNMAFRLVESDSRKAVFLRTVIRELDLNALVLNERIEALEVEHVDVLSARALSSLDSLLAYANKHLKEGSIALFPKGATHQQELDEALENWVFDLQTIPSMTDPAAVIYAIKDIQRAASQ